MTTRDFCYWLQGFFELNGMMLNTTLNPDQVKVIKNHLNMVFLHDIDPQAPKDQQAKLNSLHGGEEGSGVVARC